MDKSAEGFEIDLRVRGISPNGLMNIYLDSYAYTLARITLLNDEGLGIVSAVIQERSI